MQLGQINRSLSYITWTKQRGSSLHDFVAALATPKFVDRLQFETKSSAVAEMVDRALTTIDGPWGRKWGHRCCAPFCIGGARSPSNTMWPGPMPTTVPSGVLIHPPVWQQYATNPKNFATKSPPVFEIQNSENFSTIPALFRDASFPVAKINQSTRPFAGQ